MGSPFLPVWSSARRKEPSKSSGCPRYGAFALEKTISVKSIVASAHSVQAQDDVADNQSSAGALG
jgi:hypothetical protein